MDATIIAGSLDDKELRKSIDDLVKYVDNQTHNMASNFVVAMNTMKGAMKDFAVSQKVSVDLMQDAWKQMSASFDAMLKAQQNATSSGNNNGAGGANAAQEGTIGWLREQSRLQSQIVDQQKIGTAEKQKEVDKHAAINSQLKEELKSTKQIQQETAKRTLKNVLSLPQNELKEAEYRLKVLLNTASAYKTRKAGIFSEEQWNKLNNAIAKTRQQIDKLQEKKPKSLDDVLGMDAKSIDQIAAKMRALKTVQIDPNNTAEIKRVGDAYAELKRKQAQLMGQNIQLTHSNNYLAQSFGYIRNRVVYALTLGAITNFVKQLYEIRGQYELLERSLGVLVGSFEKGTQIFNELNEMAIKSPFTLIELGTAAKQLTAYNFAANEVVDTTRRLADISAALGVPMERLTYNLGQIKAQGILNARDARDFANAGLAIVPMLAKMYTEQKTFGDEMVTTAQVYDMMSKKMVTYSDVLKVLYRVTDEGGKFFDFQAKQAETLRVQMANLTLAYNNMLNEIGSEGQGILTGVVSGIKTLLKHWMEISRVILTVITTLGMYKGVATIVSALNSRMFVGSVLVGIRNYIRGIKNATGAMATFNAVTKMNPIGLLVSALTAAISYFVLFKNTVKDASEEVEMFGESAAKSINKVRTLQKILQGSANTSSTYKKTLSELSNVMSEYGVKLDAEKANRDEINKATEQTIQLIKEEAAERQRANNITKGEENYNKGIKDAKDAFYSEISDISDLTDIDGQTKKFRKELEDNAQAISDVVATIVEDNISLVVGKSGNEATKGMLEIQEKVSGAMSSMGISSKATQYLLYNTDILRDLIVQTRKVSEEQLNYNNKIDSYYDAAKKATQSTMTFTEKVNANARALRNNTDDAISLYNRVYDIVKLAKENHTINFDLKLSAEKLPKWMFDKSLPELQQLAERFTAIAQSGGHAKGYDRENTYERALQYASAARIKQEEEERKSRQKDKKTRTKQSDEIANAIKKEISLVKELQSAYDTLIKKGDSHANAIAKVRDLYGKTIDLLNKDMDKFGLPRLDLSIIKGNNHNEVLVFFEKLRDVLESKGLSNLERMEAVEGVVKEFRLKANTYNLDMITKGLNNELGKLKDEYELAVELDANPEFGGIFADMMGISKDELAELPRTFDDALKKMQDSIDKELGGGVFNLADNLNKGVFQSWVELQGKAMDSEQIKALEKYVDEANKIRRNETENQIKEWDKLLEKYAEYEYKRKQIIEQYEREMAIARKKNASQDIINAIENRRDKELASLDFGEFTKTSDWIVATGDLANLSKSAIGMLIAELEKYKRAAKNLDAKQIKQINSALSKLYKEQRKNNPFRAISNMLQEAKERAEQYQDEIDEVQKEMEDLDKKSIGGLNDDEKKRLDELIKKWEELKKKQQDVGKIDATQWVGAINETVGAVQQAVGVFDDLAKAIGGINTSDLDKVFSVLEKGGQGAAIGAQVGGGYGAIIGGVAGLLSGIITTFADEWSGNADISEMVESSARSVKRLENAYKSLEHAIEEAYGVAEMGAKRTAIANKELQLAGLKHQLQLEQSRDSKDRDDNRIEELRGQISDLENDIHDATKNITNDLLGISSVGDAAETVVLNMIKAFKNGEDYMKVFSDSFDDMIDNMIMKAIVGKVIGERIESLLESIQESKDKSVMKSEMKEGYGAGRTFEEELERLTWGLAHSEGQESHKAWEEMYEDWKRQYDEAIKITPQDVSDARNTIEGWKDSVKDELEAYMDAYGVKYGQDANKNLSTLQQGIQGVTEDTAGAIEAYMNIVAQRVFEQNLYLQEIRDHLNNFDLDVQLGTLSQMLLQLQQSYQVQQNIESILTGVLNPSGRAIVVELNS